MIRAVFFDVGNTLIHPYPSVGEIYREIALKYGMEIDTIAINSAFGRVLLNRSAIPLNDTKSEKKWWKDLVWEIISSLCRPKHFDSFFDELFVYFIRADAWRLYPDVTSSLDRLKEMDLTLGIISNWDSRLPPLLDNLDLTRYFSIIAVSALVGSAKPDRGIFEYALKESNIIPENAIHIGDSVELDCKGAKDCGMLPVLINRGEHAPDASPYTTIHSLDGVFSFLS